MPTYLKKKFSSIYENRYILVFSINASILSEMSLNIIFLSEMKSMNRKTFKI